MKRKRHKIIEDFLCTVLCCLGGKMKFVMILSALLLLLVAQPRSQTCGNCVDLGLVYNIPSPNPPPGWSCSFNYWLYCAPDAETDGYCLAYGNLTINDGCSQHPTLYPPYEYQFGLNLTQWFLYSTNPWPDNEPTFSSDEFLLACNPGPTTQIILELLFRDQYGVHWIHWYVRARCT